MRLPRPYVMMSVTLIDADYHLLIITAGGTMELNLPSRKMIYG